MGIVIELRTWIHFFDSVLSHSKVQRTSYTGEPTFPTEVDVKVRGPLEIVFNVSEVPSNASI